MTPADRRDWNTLVSRYARAAGVDLAPATVDELAAHLEDIYLSEIESGATPPHARASAMAALEQAGITSLRQLTLDPRPDPRHLHTRIAHDTARASSSRSLAVIYSLRMALRQFRQHPTFALITVLVLGLGTGAAATVYTIVDSVVLRPLPYRAPDRLVALWDSNTEKGLAHEPISPVTFMDYRKLSVFEDAAAWWRPDVNLVDPGIEPVRVKTIETSSNLFKVLGVSPQLGPGFADHPTLFSRDLAIVISDKLWRTRYNADPSIIGRQLKLNDEPWTVVGIMPAGFGYPGDIEVWQQLRWDLTQHSRSAHFMEAVARLAPQASLEQASNEAASLAGRLGKEFANSNGGWQYRLVPLLDDQLGYYRPALMVLFGAVGLLLVIGCLNVASLLLTRALARDREIAVRFALGAAPRQLITQLIAESLVLSAAGAIAGLAFTAAALPIIVAVAPVPIPRLAEAAINPRVLLFCLGLIVSTTIVFGLVPALVLLRKQLATSLRAGERGSSIGVRRVYHGLVMGEVALACALLIGSALLVRSVSSMTATPLGVDGRDVTVTSVQLSGDAYTPWQSVADTQAQILARIRSYPGVRAAGATNFLPVETGWRGPTALNGAGPAQANEADQEQSHSVSDGYFEAMGARLVEGRLFNDRDISKNDAVAIVNEAFVKRYAAGKDIRQQVLTNYAGQIGPLGRNLKAVRVDNHWQLGPVAIVGVIADVRNTPIGQPIEPAVYFPMAQFPFRAVSVAIAARDSATAVAAVRQALKEVAPTTPLGAVDTWAHKFSLKTAEPQLLMSTLTAFGALSAFLAALGVYGLFSWSVALRRRELAIRLTLGARPGAVGASVVSQSALLVAVGLVVGWGIVRLAEAPLATVLFNVKPGDAASTISAAAFLFGASLLACLPAAFRAMRVNPVEGLRNE